MCCHLDLPGASAGDARSIDAPSARELRKDSLFESCRALRHLLAANCFLEMTYEALPRIGRGA